MTTIQGGQTNLWLPIIFSSLYWEILCPGKLWKWTYLEQGSTLFQVFWLCIHCCWLPFRLKFRKNRKAISQQVMKHLMSIFVYQNKQFSVLRLFRPEVEWCVLHLRIFLANRPHICLIDHKAEVAVGETVCEGFERCNWVVRSWCYSLGHSYHSGCLQVCVIWIFFKKPCENRFLHRQAELDGTSWQCRQIALLDETENESKFRTDLLKLRSSHQTVV